MTSTHNFQTMNRRNALTISALTLVGLSIFGANASEANQKHCRPANVLADYQEFVKGGADSSLATELAISENGNNTTACKYRINAALVDAGLQPYFFRNSLARTRQAGNAQTVPSRQIRPAANAPTHMPKSYIHASASSQVQSSDIREDECYSFEAVGKTACKQRSGGTAKRKSTTRVASRNCAPGTSYHKIKTGGLIFKRTVAEGCFSDYEAAQLKINAQDSHSRHVRGVLQNANQNRMRQCFGSANVYGNTVYGNSTCY